MLEIRGLRSAYGRIEVLHGVDVSITQGHIVALIGANGAGKSTLLRALSGVQPISSGDITFEGGSIAKATPHARVSAGIIHVPEGRQIFQPLAVEDNLKLGAFRRRRDPAADMQKIYGMFPILYDKRKLPAGGLSGGQQQMLAIGRAIMGNPRLLLLDEPSMGLAPVIVEQIFHVIRDLRASGVTIFLVEQNASAALAIADRAYVLEAGKIVLSGAGRDLATNDAVRQAYLGI